MRIIQLDASVWETRADARKAIHDALELSEEYASNLDALHDALTEADGIAVNLTNSGIMTEKLGKWGLSLIRMMKDASEENTHITVTIE